MTHIDSSIFIMVNIFGLHRASLNVALFDYIISKAIHLKIKYPSAFVFLGVESNESPDSVADGYPPRRVSDGANPLIRKL